jgi:hypothetical protein
VYKIQGFVHLHDRYFSQGDAELPEVLFLVFDNTCKDMKNNHILAFCALLVCKYLYQFLNNSNSAICAQVRLKIFKKVFLHFLMVGHTHNPIDQCFSVIAKKLERSDIAAVTDLFKILETVCW